MVARPGLPRHDPVRRIAATRSACRDSDNAALEDFALLAAQYRRAYARAVPTYTGNDKRLGNAALNLFRTVNPTCARLGQSSV